MPPRVVLVGPSGAGKTTVGRLLARRWAVEFADSDTLVEREAGTSVADIFVEQGEARFRELEKAAVGALLEMDDGVLALGGGAILDPDTRLRLRGHRVVFLDVALADATKRIGMNRDRPLLLGNPRAQLHALMEARRGLYEEVASLVVSTSGRAVESVADDVVEALA